MTPNYRAQISNGYGRGHRLYVSWDDCGARRGPNGGVAVHVVTGFTSDVVEEGCDYNVSEGIRNADALIQAIVDAAWEEGFRPIGFKDVRNETAAIRDHLGDMRAIAAHNMGVALPEIPGK